MTATSEKKRWKDQTKEERRLYHNKKNKESLQRKNANKPARKLKDGKKAQKAREYANRHYQKKKLLDPEKTLKAGRLHQKNLRVKRAGGAVALCVKNAIRNVLKPFRKNDTKVRNQKRRQNIAMEKYKMGGIHRTRTLLAARCKTWVTNKKTTKSDKTFNLVGVTPAEAHRHVANQLLEGESMNCIEIDHIFPFARYNVESTEDQKKVMNYKNLQPLTKVENVKKIDRLPTKAMAAKVPKELWPDGITEDMLPDIYDGWATPLRMNAA